VLNPLWNDGIIAKRNILMEEGEAKGQKGQFLWMLPEDALNIDQEKKKKLGLSDAEWNARIQKSARAKNMYLKVGKISKDT
jgi:hypothetical protein